MKYLLAIIIAALTCASLNTSARAEDGTMFTLKTGVASRYIFSDGARLHGPVEQTALLAKLPHGIMAGVWQSSGLDDLKPASNGGDELAVGAGWHSHLRSVLVEAGIKHHLNAHVGATTIPEVEVGVMAFQNDSHAIEPYINMETHLRKNHTTIEVSGGTHHRWRLWRGSSFRQRFSVQRSSSLGDAAHAHHITLAVYHASFGWVAHRTAKYSVTIIGPWARFYMPIAQTTGHTLQDAYGLSVEVNWRSGDVHLQHN